MAEKKISLRDRIREVLNPKTWEMGELPESYSLLAKSVMPYGTKVPYVVSDYLDHVAFCKKKWMIPYRFYPKMELYRMPGFEILDIMVDGKFFGCYFGFDKDGNDRVNKMLRLGGFRDDIDERMALFAAYFSKTELPKRIM